MERKNFVLKGEFLKQCEEAADEFGISVQNYIRHVMIQHFRERDKEKKRP